MGVRSWVVGPIIALLLVAASAAPPKCEEAPPWSVGGRQPLAETKAQSLEFLRQYFSNNGINDIEFIIVNSKLNHAKLLRKELENRVSFEVFQDNDEEDIWNVMEGDKDDIYVYDRCGRLAYFIPYPLSVMTTADGLVPRAILSTYFANPCNGTCDNISGAESDSDDKQNGTPEEGLIYTTLSYELSNLTDKILFYPTNENESLAANGTSVDSNIVSSEDYDIDDDYTSESHNNSQNSGIVNEIHNLFFNNSSDNSSSEASGNYHLNETDHLEQVQNNTAHLIENRTESHVHIQTNLAYIPSKSPNTGKRLAKAKKSDRCKEADFYVCKDFSKRRLMRIQNCCKLEESGKPQPLACRKFGKKRCKKLQTVLKCCFKTSFSRETARTLEETTTLVYSTTSFHHQVCCRDTVEGKICRASETTECDREGEYPATDQVATEASM